MSEEDLWERAAACVQAAQASEDAKMRVILTCLGNFWIGLIHKRPDEIDHVTALTIAEVAQAQAELIEMRPTFH
jgi:hypothetical protein